MNKYLGSNFDIFLTEEGIKEDVTKTALKRVLAYQLKLSEKDKKRSPNSTANKQQ